MTSPISGPRSRVWAGRGTPRAMQSSIPASEAFASTASHPCLASTAWDPDTAAFLIHLDVYTTHRALCVNTTVAASGDPLAQGGGETLRAHDDDEGHHQ